MDLGGSAEMDSLPQLNGGHASVIGVVERLQAGDED